jgi:thiamine-phosphate pyrophosphorylase
VSIVQIREKRLTAKQVFEITRIAVAIASQSSTLILVNERFDIAIAAGADGVHLPSDSIIPTDIRRVVPPGFMIGVSTHSADEVLKARNAGADFALFGPVFSTPGKPGAVGLEELRRACETAAPFPVLALGGIDGSNADAAIDAGAAGVAAIRFMNSPAGLDFALRLQNEKH